MPRDQKIVALEKMSLKHPPYSYSAVRRSDLDNHEYRRWPIGRTSAHALAADSQRNRGPLSFRERDESQPSSRGGRQIDLDGNINSPGADTIFLRS